MHPDTATTETAHMQDNAVSPKMIVIVSRNLFQNRLIKIYFENTLTDSCAVRMISEWSDIPEENFGGQSLALLDCFDMSPADIWKKIGLGGGPDPAVQALSLFNVKPGAGGEFEFEAKAIEHRVRGVFYMDEWPERLAKGVEKILCGELWFTRRTTSQFLLNSARFRPRSHELEAMLTAREKEILVAIASGSSNMEMSKAFSISLNTVKTHIYNIYKKIDVRNRLEATLWVARYL